MNLYFDSIPYGSRKQLEKSARDTGYDIPVPGEMLHFRCTDSPGEIALGLSETGPVAGFKVPPVLPPFKGTKIEDPSSPEIPGFDTSSWYIFDDFAHLENALRMYYMENRGSRIPVLRASPEILNAITETEKEMLVEIRTKQGQFREKLMQYWGGKCAITGITQPELLRASHIKPWADSSDHERLDPYNGLLLNAFADATFDRGLISFDNNGKLLMHTTMQKLSPDHRTLLGSVKLEENHIKYMEYHRTNVFMGV